ncbi:uncharacterized protein LOC119557701 [Drosophila subpulchrella]|uniref:uncharacterized protein LOC119557701 n=1 Tax=Drosophila subpulchrella TaxID=1486046 RepID=UPI0018A12E97|nr:uncharacterized protein LOC119557701 [Drosophila subpulchrella]
MEQMQDVNQDRGEEASGSKDLELEENDGNLSRNSSLTTVCSTFPLTSRIDSYHRWQSMDKEEDVMGCELQIESERKVQLAMSMPLAIDAIRP